MSNLRWSSLEELVAIQEKMNRLFEDALYRREFPDEPSGTASGWTPAADAYEGTDQIVISVEIPGASLSDVRLEFEGGRLRLSGTRRESEASHRFLRMERVHGDFVREFEIPGGVDPDAVTASLQRGILTITIPRPPARSPGRRSRPA
jgi:HSP20 family protein